ncbi:ABC transporter transmembrane region 2-domain-containing protein [Suillus clintonianus]|uniref:ABC transporter transmembrane region 2-domain-containing protein n=1 Tax=Suillus clintonianus TaxID=1904413 RepID=UPI001B86AFD7|nr:ABC transporter transmembrane region 2-domain-containing protein [Suillus clintonianus]KAG2124174.1 ABC transporter transmembrane region 2-domain-containing protein [Suillus clintonianus]
MAIFSKLLYPQLNELLRQRSSRRPLLVLLASVLILRSSLFKPITADRSKSSTSNALGLPTHSQTELAKDAVYFPLVNPSPGLGLPFLHQLRSLLRIVLPSLYTREALLLTAHSTFLVLRTVLSIAVARLDGRIVRDLVSADGKGFLTGLGLWFALAVPSIYTNSMIRHLQSTLSLRFRTRLTRYIHDLYLSSAPHLRYYRVPLHGVDQYITADVDAWAESVAGIYGNLMKPSLDLLLFTSQLARSLGFRGTVLLFINYYVTAKILRAVTPAFGRLAAVEARLEGEYRAGVGRVGRESEEIAFYDGGARERDILTRVYLRLIKHVNSIYKIRIAYEWTEDFVIKYLWSAAGYGLIAVPLLITRKRSRVTDGTRVADGEDAGKGERKKRSDADGIVAARTETYISNRRLLLSLADAGGRLMYAYKDLQEVAGLTGRLYTLLSTLHNLPALPPALQGDGDTFALKDVDICVPGYPFVSAQPQLDSPSPKPSHSTTNSDLKGTQSIPNPNSGSDPSILTSSDPNLKSETLSGTNTTTLVRALTLTLRPGMHLMITGSNGVGKTAVARVLAGLWAPGSCSTLTHPTDSALTHPTDGTLTRPTDDANGRPGVFVIPQRPYHPTGSLLSQVIYPQPVSEFSASFKALEELEGLLCAAHLGYLVDREGGWDAVKEWRDVLSGGEKQRLAMARLFYHRPKFAILDECTSAVSSDVEGQMYEHAKALGITLITISLRPSLTKYHTYILTLTGDGTGSWTFSRIAMPRAQEGDGNESVEGCGENGSAEGHSTSQPVAEDGESEPTAALTEDSGARYLAHVLEEIRVLEARIEESCGWEKRVRELGEALKAQ